MYSRRFPPTFMLRIPSSSPCITCYSLGWISVNLQNDYQTIWPQNYCFSSLNTNYNNEGEILKLDNIKSNIQSLPDQNQHEKYKADLSPVNCKIEKGGKEQHIMYLPMSSSKASNSFLSKCKHDSTHIIVIRVKSEDLQNKNWKVTKSWKRNGQVSKI